MLGKLPRGGGGMLVGARGGGMLAGATPVRMGNVNGGIALLLQAFVFLSAVGSFLTS